MIYEGLERHAGLFEEHTELRVQENRSTTVTLLNGDAILNTSESSRGVSARVYRKGSWGFASLTGTEDADIARAVHDATANARFLADRKARAGRGVGPVGGRALPVSARSGIHDYSTDKPRRGPSDILDFLRSIDAFLASKHPEVLSRKVMLRTLDMEKILLTSEGASAATLTPRALIYVIMSRAAAAGDTVEVWDVMGNRGHFEDVFERPEDLFPSLEEHCAHLAAKADGVYPDAGVHEVILGPDLSGILAHEAIGHTTEGDLVLGGSVAGDHRGQQVASELVSLVDFAHAALGAMCPVPVWVDDEGTPAEDVCIIDRGVLRSFMHSKETAMALDSAPTGNARASAFSDEPLVRMRNTAILPGASRLADMIASVDKGYYLLASGSGQADSTSEFMFSVPLGYEIRKGKLGKALRDTTVSGVAFDMLKTVSMVSNDMQWMCRGFCGKKQLIPVGMGGPAIKCRIAVGGR